MHLCTELIAASIMIEPLGEVGANFSLQLSLRTQFTKINNKKVIAENQCEKHKRSSLAMFFFSYGDPCLSLIFVQLISVSWVILHACRFLIFFKVSKGAKIRNRYNQVPHLTQDTNGKVTNSQLDNTNESQEVSPFPAGDHKAHINRCAQRHSKHKTEQKHKRSTKEVPPWNGQ